MTDTTTIDGAAADQPAAADGAAHDAAHGAASTGLGVVRRFIGWLARIVVGGFLCLHPIGSLLILGWTQRRAAVKAQAYWHDVAGHRLAQPLPGWVFGTKTSQGWRRWFGGLRDNLTVGVATAFNASILLLPATVFMLFAWWGGWENSFNKGYEQAWVGPTVSLVGIAWFIPAAMYSLFAQGRQAVAGWRAFFDWRLNLTLMLSRPWQVGILAMAALLGTLPFTLARMLPFFFPDIIAGFDTMDVAQYEALAWQYSWATLIYLVALGLWLRHLAALCYAAACLHCLKRGDVTFDMLRDPEQAALQSLNLHEVTIETPPRWWWRLIRRFSDRVQQIGFLMGAAMAWFGVIAQLYIAQFANHSWILWVNHPVLSFAWVPVPQVY
ncbi:MAG: hypothetical protein AAF213_06600 [Pseudomonadota bacterium]